MKILMIAPQPFLEPRGTPISVYQRITGLIELGHQVDLVTYHVGEDIDLPGLVIHRAPRLPWVKQMKVGPSWAKIPMDALLLLKTFRLMLRKKYDVIHSHEEAAFFAVCLSAIFRTPHLYDMHSSLPKQLVNFNFGNHALFIKLFQLLERWVVRSCDALITIGGDLEEHASSIKPGVNQIMIENLPLHASVPSTPSQLAALKDRLDLDRKTTIVYTGTLEKYQGIDMLIECLAVVRTQQKDAVLVIVGGRPEQIEDLKAVARRLNVEDGTRFVGTVSVQDVDQYVEIADILVSPRVEGTSVPLKIYSYLSSGKPIVATNLIAHTLALSEEVAVLTDPNKESYAAGILKLFRDPELRSRLGQQAKTLAREKYGKGRYLARLDQLYKTLQPAKPPTYSLEDVPEN